MRQRLHQANWMNMENAQIFWCKKKQEQQENQIKNVQQRDRRLETMRNQINNKCSDFCSDYIEMRARVHTLHMLPFTRWWLILLLCIAFFFQLINDFTFQICTQSTRNQAYCASVLRHFSQFIIIVIIICIIESRFFFSARLFENLWQMCTDEWNLNATLKYETLYVAAIKPLDIKTQDEKTLWFWIK